MATGAGVRRDGLDGEFRSAAARCTGGLIDKGSAPRREDLSEPPSPSRRALANLALALFVQHVDVGVL